MAELEGRWVTMNGAKVFISARGDVIMGLGENNVIAQNAAFSYSDDMQSIHSNAKDELTNNGINFKENFYKNETAFIMSDGHITITDMKGFYLLKGEKTTVVRSVSLADPKAKGGVTNAHRDVNKKIKLSKECGTVAEVNKSISSFVTKIVEENKNECKFWRR